MRVFTRACTPLSRRRGGKSKKPERRRPAWASWCIHKGRPIMRANCWMGKRDMRVEQVPDPKILNQRDAIVKITSTAICGSDLHLYNGFVPTMESGDILGHEFMGEVVEVGRGVNNLQRGDRVVVPFPIACGSCFSCEH